MKYLVIIMFPMILNWMLSCSGHPKNNTSDSEDSPGISRAAEPARKVIRLDAPAENQELKLNREFHVSISAERDDDIPDSVKIWFDGKPAGEIHAPSRDYIINGALASATGRKPLKVVAYMEGKAVQTITRFLVVYSDTPPARMGYRIIKEYPHDREAYTQGLAWHNGFLYEGTGQETRSNLRKVRLETGEVLNQQNLETQLFGEGITIWRGKIFQLTWRNKVGFIYDLETFRLLNKVYYQTEGWGITSLNDRLVMSDGTNVLYIIDPESFTVSGTLEVYDNEARVSELNELEYINGEIWANIWQKDLIARIDPESGKLIAYVDLSGLLANRNQNGGANELNGIAWDSQSGRIFVTGKNWPKIFEIKVTE